MIAPLLAGGFGLLIGSFLAGLSWRWPQGLPWAQARSACAACNTRLGPLDLVPVLSHLALRGRCRHCHAPIPRRHLTIELAAGLIGVIATLALPLPLALAAMALGWLLLLLLVLDLEHFWLPLAPMALIALAGLALATPLPLVDRLIGGVAGVLSLELVRQLYARLRGREGMGGGDPLLLGAIGCWTGPALLPLVLLLAGLVGLALLLLDRARGRPLAADTMVPLGSLLATAAWPLWLLLAAGRLDRLLP
jgi:leader peptidase (prepilin peptidase)/N-methyltransferase